MNNEAKSNHDISELSEDEEKAIDEERIITHEEERKINHQLGLIQFLGTFPNLHDDSYVHGIHFGIPLGEARKQREIEEKDKVIEHNYQSAEKWKDMTIEFQGQIEELESKLAKSIETLNECKDWAKGMIESNYFRIGKEYLSRDAIKESPHIKHVNKVLKEIGAE